ncbi:MAG: hypothetical protein AB1429_08290 [Pseudomonadota bacterium]|jgi:hypothetical protein
MAEENDIAKGIIEIAKANNNLCTFKRAYKEIPHYVKLSAQNTAPSLKRPGEPMWHQLVRNIKSHYKTPGNYIYAGYLIHVPKVGYRLP